MVIVENGLVMKIESSSVSRRNYLIDSQSTRTLTSPVHKTFANFLHLLTRDRILQFGCRVVFLAVSSDAVSSGEVVRYSLQGWSLLPNTSKM